MAPDYISTLPTELLLKLSYLLTCAELRICRQLSHHWHALLSLPEISARLTHRRRVDRNFDEGRVVKLSTVAAHSYAVTALKIEGDTLVSAARAEQAGCAEIRVWSLKNLKRLALFVVPMPTVTELGLSETAGVVVAIVRGEQSPLRMIAYHLSATTDDPKPLYKVEQLPVIRHLSVSARYVATIDQVQMITIRNVKDGVPIMLTFAYDAPLTDRVIGLHLLPTHLLLATSTGLLRATSLPTLTKTAIHGIHTIHQIPKSASLFTTFSGSGSLCLALGPRALAYYYLSPSLTPLGLPTARMTGIDNLDSELSRQVASVDFESGRFLVLSNISSCTLRDIWIGVNPAQRMDDMDVPVRREIGWISPRLTEQGGRFCATYLDGPANVTTRPPLCVDRRLWADDEHRWVKKALRVTVRVVRAVVGAECVVMGTAKGKIVVALFDERGK